MKRQQLTLIKVKVNENQRTKLINLWITKLPSKYKEVSKTYDPANTIIFANADIVDKPEQ